MASFYRTRIEDTIKVAAALFAFGIYLIVVLWIVIIMSGGNLRSVSKRLLEAEREKSDAQKYADERDHWDKQPDV